MRRRLAAVTLAGLVALSAAGCNKRSADDGGGGSNDSDCGSVFLLAAPGKPAPPAKAPAPKKAPTKPKSNTKPLDIDFDDCGEDD